MKFLLKRRHSKDERNSDSSPFKKMPSQSHSDAQRVDTSDLSSKTPPKNYQATSPRSSPLRLSQRPSVDDKSENDSQDPFAGVPTFAETNPSEHHSLFIIKLKLCSRIYDFRRNVDIQAKDSKLATLKEISKYISVTEHCFSENVIQEITEMVKANLFRTSNVLHQTTTPMMYLSDPEEEEEPIFETSWPHLFFVYEIFLRLIASDEVELKVLKQYIDTQFVFKLLELIASEDPRERDALKTIIHRIYAKLMLFRPTIRQNIQHTFYTYIYENETHKGITELLEILGRYVEKDGKLAEPIIKGLLKYWPQTNTSKEVAFITELEEILDLIQPNEFQKIMVPLFQQLALCIQSPHFQVAERVLFFWNNDYIVRLVNTHKEVIYPLIIASINKCSKNHWSGNVHEFTNNVLKLLADTDFDLYNVCANLNPPSHETDENTNETWCQLENQFYDRTSKT